MQNISVTSTFLPSFSLTLEQEFKFFSLNLILLALFKLFPTSNHDWRYKTKKCCQEEKKLSKSVEKQNWDIQITIPLRKASVVNDRKLFRQKAEESSCRLTMLIKPIFLHPTLLFCQENRSFNFSFFFWVFSFLSFL